jgi:hypothetical protein
MKKALEASLSVNAGEVASAYSEPEKIKLAVYAARLDALNLALFA